MTRGTVRSEQVRHSRVRRVVRRDESRFWPLGFLPWLGLFLLALFALIPFANNAIEAAAERGAQQALAGVDAAWVDLEVSGQWVTLKGEPPSAEAAARAEQAVRNVEASTFLGYARPVTRVRTDFRNLPVPIAETPSETDGAGPVSPPTDPPSADPAPEWTFQLREGTMVLEGQVADATMRDRIVDAARDRLSPPRFARIDDRLEVDRVDDDIRYVEIARRSVGVLARCNQGSTRFLDATYSFTCSAPSAAVDSIEAAAGLSLPIGNMGVVEILSAQAVESCERSIASVLNGTRIEFATGSARINPSSDPLLDLLAEAARACPGTLRVEGHTDNTGSADLNLDLSERRAAAVRQALIVRGVPANRLIAEGYGELRPRETNSTVAGRARNRRIEIRVIDDVDEDNRP